MNANHYGAVLVLGFWIVFGLVLHSIIVSTPYNVTAWERLLIQLFLHFSLCSPSAQSHPLLSQILAQHTE